MANVKADLDSSAAGRPKAPWPAGSDVAPTEVTPLMLNKGSGARGSDDDGGGGDGGGGRGLTTQQAALLIAGEMAGSGVLALPRALAKTGWVGLPVIVLMCAIAAYGGSRLGECWAIIEERNPELRSRQRNPYAIIAHHALGRKGSVLVSACAQVTLVGAGVVYLLLAAQIAEELMRPLFPSLSFCMWLLCISLLVAPALWLGSPKDFSFVGPLAFGSTVVACVFFFIQTLNDVKPFRVYRYGIHGFEEFFLAFGTILFSFGGASTFPTIQNDMAEKVKFSKSIILAFSAILGLYVPLTVAAYAVYGENVAPNLVMSLSPTLLTTMGNLLMAVHLVLAFVIILNPVFQEWEETLGVPREFCWRRAALRTGLLLAMLLVAETVPKFSAVLALVGGSTVALLTYVLPTLCYMRLSRQPQTSTPIYMKVVFWEIIAIGTIGGLAATYSAFSAIFSNRMAPPCYLR